MSKQPRQDGEVESGLSMSGRPKRGVPEGLWIQCPSCKATIFRKDSEAKFNICPECQHHFYLPAADRIRQMLDDGSFEELGFFFEFIIIIQIYIPLLLK